ncbi:MAG: hypothetical protein JJU45_06580 [Acidimicrobiia bacterium]|nr:hypothetical protein [Acidimicrobiia bacterium]
MPVRPTRTRSPRSLVLGVAALVAGIAAVLTLFVLAIPRLTEDGRIEARLGEPVFSVGSAEGRAEAIAADGPILFPDPAGGQREIFVQHLGSTPDDGWHVFDARRPGQGRECTLVWDDDAAQFDDPCDDATVPADGEGLRQYGVYVEEGEVIVDLRDGATAGPANGDPDTDGPDTGDPDTDDPAAPPIERTGEGAR